MNNTLSEYDIQKLLKDIENMEKKPSITEITPEEIKKIDDEVLRNETHKAFQDVDFAYVKPMENLLNHIISRRSAKKYSYDLSDLSIVARMGVVEKKLLEFGCSTDDIMDLVPKTTEEVNILSDARRQGFVSVGVVDNNTRISQAKNWLGMDSSYQVHGIDKTSNHGR